MAFSSCRALACDDGCGLEDDVLCLALPATLPPTLPPTAGFEDEEEDEEDEEDEEEGVARLSLLIPEARPWLGWDGVEAGR